MIRTEVLIVGGGPAGAACAWALRRQGVPCLVLERATFPRVKLCAGWITPDALEAIDLDPNAYPHGLTRLERLRVSVGGLRLRLRSRTMAIRRVEFDDFLLKRAGVPVHQHHARSITQRDDGYAVDGEFWGRRLVGAGGTQCPVARTLFADANPRPAGSLIVTQEQEFAYPIGDGERRSMCHLWFFEHGLPGYAWYVPKAGGYVNVGVGGSAAKLKARGDRIQRHWDCVVAELDRLGLVRDFAYAPKGHAYYLRERGRTIRVGNAFVAGDAAGLATMDMGEGIATAIQSGVRVAEGIATGTEVSYEDLRTLSQPAPIGYLLAAAMR